VSYEQLASVSERTQEAYLRAVRQLADYFRTSPDQLSEQQVRHHSLHLKNDRTFASASLGIAYSGIKFFYSHTIPRDWPTLQRLRVRKEKALPDVLFVDEVRQLIAAVRTLHNRTHFWTVYSLGLRLGEGLHLQVGDIANARDTDARQSQGAPGADTEHLQAGSRQTAKKHAGKPHVRLLAGSKRGTGFRTASLVGRTKQKRRRFCSPSMGTEHGTRRCRWSSPDDRNARRIPDWYQRIPNGTIRGAAVSSRPSSLNADAVHRPRAEQAERSEIALRLGIGRASVRRVVAAG
jgi:integrase